MELPDKETCYRALESRDIGDWTAQYIALRALRELDAFPVSDIGLLRGVAKVDGAPATSKSLLLRAESRKPRRAYAAQQLWAPDSAQTAIIGEKHAGDFETAERSIRDAHRRNGDCSGSRWEPACCRLGGPC